MAHIERDAAPCRRRLIIRYADFITPLPFFATLSLSLRCHYYCWMPPMPADFQIRWLIRHTDISFTPYAISFAMLMPLRHCWLTAQLFQLIFHADIISHFFFHFRYI
jgi:hypothetical protein